MGYASLADLEMRLGGAAYVQLTDAAGTGQADAEVAAEALGGAEGEVDSYLARRYAVPVAVAGEPAAAAVLKSVTLDLAEHRLHARRPTMPNDAIRRREAAVRWLERVAAGQAVLPTAREPAGNAALGIAAEAVGAERVMSRKGMENL